MKDPLPLLAGLPDVDAPTPEQLARIAERERAHAERLAAMLHVKVMEQRQPHGAETNCARCAHVAAFNSEKQSAFCLWMRRMVGTWHPVVCDTYEPA